MSAQQTLPLAAALRLLAGELNAQQPPPELQGRLFAAWRAQRHAAAPARWRWPRSAWAWPAGAAACAVVALGSALLLLRPPPPLLVDDGLRFGTFMPVAPPERWPLGGAPAWLVRTELPGERLAALGLPYDPARAGDSVRAELLMHPSGEVLAVRLVP